MPAVTRGTAPPVVPEPAADPRQSASHGEGFAALLEPATAPPDGKAGLPATAVSPGQAAGQSTTMGGKMPPATVPASPLPPETAAAAGGGPESQSVARATAAARLMRRFAPAAEGQARPVADMPAQRTGPVSPADPADKSVQTPTDRSVAMPEAAEATQDGATVGRVPPPALPGQPPAGETKSGAEAAPSAKPARRGASEDASPTVQGPGAADQGAAVVPVPFEMRTVAERHAATDDGSADPATILGATPADGKPKPAADADNGAASTAADGPRSTAEMTGPQMAVPQTPAPQTAAFQVTPAAAAAAQGGVAASGASEQVAIHVSRALRDGTGTITIDLHPAELGRVEVRLSFQTDGTSVRMTVDRPETFAAFSHDRSGLEQQLAQAGVDVSGGGLDLRLGSQSDHSEWPTGGGGSRASSGASEPAVPQAPVWVGRGLVDILA